MNSDDNQTQLTFLDTQLTLNSKGRNSKIKYLFDLPFDVRREFCNLLDADHSWRELGGIHIGLTETDLELYSHAILRNQSPTNTMLCKWEQSNVTIVHLYICLEKKKHLRAMSILKPFVDPSLHCRCDYREASVASLTEADHATAGNSASNAKAQSLANDAHDEQNASSPNRRLAIDHHHHRDERRDAATLNNGLKANDKHLNVKPYNIPSQTPSAFKNSFSAVASTINAYDDNLPYEEILAATNNFHISNVIGSGGFGVVYKGHWKGTKVAIKRLKDCVNFAQAITELRVLSQYRIDNIVPLYGISMGSEACLVYQFLVNGSLDDRLQCKRNTPPLTWPQRINIGLGIGKALNYLHTRKGKPLIHGDVKSANILLDAQMQAKLGDFGLAKYLQDYQQSTASSVSNQTMLNSKKNLTHITVTSVHGTVAYLPIEYLRSKILSPAVDIYSYGIVQLEMLTGSRAFDGKSLLLDKVMDELEEASSSKLSKNCQLLGEFGNLLSIKTQKANVAAAAIDDQLTVPGSMDKCAFTSPNSIACGCACLSCKLYKLRDTKLPQTLESLFWFHCTLKLALDCCNKLKKKRPDFATILKSYESFIDQFKQFNACNQIFNLTGINTNRNSFASTYSTFKDDDDAIKTPLEYKLWNDLKKKNATAPPVEPASTNTQSTYQQSKYDGDTSTDPTASDHLADTDEQLLISLSTMNRLRLDDNADRIESNSKNESSPSTQSTDHHHDHSSQCINEHDECVNEFVENCDLPLLTELGVRRG